MCEGFSILYLPDIALENIFSFLTYDKVAKSREVCKKFNEAASKYLTRGFIQLEKRHAVIYKKVKSLLPRRESERRTHPLARHCDILSAVETRISMLNMTFMKYIETNMCCFIPGKVIDEIDRVLTLVESAQAPPRTHEFLQELRDISSMAMEHFDEHILPNLKLKPSFKLATTISKPSRVFLVQNSVADELKKVRKQNNYNKQQLSLVTSHVLRLVVKIKKQNGRLKAQSSQIREQERKIQEQSTKIQEQETVIADLKKHMDEWDQKFSDLTSELIRAREELSTILPNTATSKFSPPAPHITVPPPKIYKSNIKPRTAQILPPISSLLPYDVERKRKSSSTLEVPSKLSKNDDLGSSFLFRIGDNLLAANSKVDTEKPAVKIKEPEKQEFEKPKVTEKQVSSEKQKANEKQSLGLRKGLLPAHFLSETIENLIKSPISKMRSRKRKSSEEIEYKRE